MPSVSRVMRRRMKSCNKNEPNWAAASVSTTSAEEKTSVRTLMEALATTDRTDCASLTPPPSAHEGSDSLPASTALSSWSVKSANRNAPRKKSSGVAQIQKLPRQLLRRTAESARLRTLLMGELPHA